MHKTTKRKSSFMEYIESKGDIGSPEHDSLLLKLYDEKNLIEFLKPFFPDNEIEVSNIMAENLLANKYKEFGFLDLSFNLVVKEYDQTQSYHSVNYEQAEWRDDEKKADKRYFGFIELKTKEVSFGQLSREMEFYKSAIRKCGSQYHIFSVAIADVTAPKDFDQYHIVPFSKPTGLESFL